MPNFQTVRGMRDLLANEATALNFIISRARETARLYGYKEVITPVVEPYELLSAKSGEEIRQRMFFFKDLGDRSVALRPEFTASIARLATTTLKSDPKPLRLFSVGSVYRYDEPQRGRYREFWQSNFELIGSNKAEADAEAILVTDDLMKAVGLRKYAFKIGHVGLIRGILNQENVDEKIQNAVLQRMDKREYAESFKLLKQKECRETLQGLMELKADMPFKTVQKIQEYVAGYDEAKAAADNLMEILRLISASKIPIGAVEPTFARGLEYYTGIIFEVNVPGLDIALGGGGRYNKLIEVFGGKSTPAVGVAHGLDRVGVTLQMQKTALPKMQEKIAVVIPVNQEVKAEAFKISQMLREAGVAVEFEVMGRKMKKALEDADRRKIDYAIIVGKRELTQGTVVVRNLAKRTQNTVEISKIPDEVKQNK